MSRAANGRRAAAGRGLTLVEVLAATVLLAVIAGACVPVLSGAMRALRSPDPAFTIDELGRLADAFVADPAVFDVASMGELSAASIAWPQEPTRPPVTVRRLVPATPEVTHAWLEFAGDGQSVYRCLDASSPDDAPATQDGEDPS